MRETGERYPVSPYPASIDSAGFPTPGDLLAFLPVGDDFGIRQRKEAKAAGGEPKNPVFNPLKATAEHKEYMQKLQGCQSAAKPFETSEVLTVRDRLAVKLGESLAVVQESASVASLLEDYGTCLTAHGIDITNREALYLSVSRAYPVAETATTDVRKDPRWATAITYERKAAEADKWCRRDSVDAARVAAVPALQQFVTANKTDLLANQSKWSVIEAEVKRLQVKAALF